MTSLFFVVQLSLLPQNHTYHHFTTEDGLPTDYVYGVIEDDEGYIWAYTENGVAKYDGYDWKVFTTADGLPHNDVYHMIKDKDGRLWCRNIGFIPAYIENDSIHLPTVKKRSGVYGKTWNGSAFGGLSTTGSSLQVFRSDRDIDTIPIPPEVIELGRNRLFSDSVFFPSIPLANAWTGLTNSRDELELYHWSRDDLQYYALTMAPQLLKELSSPTKTMSFITVENDIGLLKGSTDILLLNWRTGHHRQMDLQAELGYFPIRDAPLDSMWNGHYVFNTNREYVFLDDSLKIDHRFRPKEISDRYSLRRLFIDSERNRWIGTKEGGLFMIPQQHLKTATLPFATDDVRLKTAYEEFFLLDDRLFVVTDDLFIYEIVNDALVFRYHAPGSQLKQLEVIDDIIMIANSDAMIHLSLKGDRFIETEDPFPLKTISYGRIKGQEGFYKAKQNVKSFALAENELWFSIRGFLMGLKKNSGELYFDETRESRCLVHNPYSNRFLLDKGNILYSMKDRELTLLDTLPDVISELFPHSETEILVGTEKSGLFVYTADSTYRASTTGYVKSIKVTGDTLYAASKEGIVQLNRNAIGAWEESSRIDKLDGLPSNEVHDIEIVGQSIYGATYKGVFKFDIDHGIYAPSSDRTIEFKSVSLKGLPYSGEDMSISHDENDLNIEYHFNDYASNGEVLYSYRLLPIEESYRTTKERSAIYSDLSSGAYEFEIFATDIYGQTYEQSQTIRFEILAPFYARTWFRILALLLGLVLIAFVVQRYVSQKEERLRKEERLIQRVSELQMESLRSQMNPHFIFNSLGSIQYFIQTKKVDEADYYLTLFAELMREFLDSSIENMISLDKELELLKNYTELEIMRFDERFEVEFELDPRIDPLTQKVPSMLLQPFIENAINHGLRQREQLGLLRVRFLLKGESLICEISDNGIGIEAAKRNSLNKGHKSRAMQNIKDRIEVLQQSGLVDISMQIGNLYEEEEFPGTKVELTIDNLKQDEEIEIRTH